MAAIVIIVLLILIIGGAVFYLKRNLMLCFAPQVAESEAKEKDHEKVKCTLLRIEMRYKPH